MSKFIQATSSTSHEKIWIRSESISVIETLMVGSKISLIGEEIAYLKVKETPDELIKKLNDE